MNDKTDRSKRGSFHIFEEEKKEQYQYGLDLVRFAAMFLVVCYHAQVLNYLPQTPINSFAIFLCEIGRFISYSCNGLFMILTGYLKKNKKPCGSYFYKLTQFIIEYILCSIACAVFRVYHVKENLSKQQILNGLFLFNDVIHGWFVKMYIGLFLFSPFLNILYNNIKSVKVKYELMIVLIIEYSLPDTYYLFGWVYWGNGYPILYYFIGCFIKDFQPSMNKLNNISLIMICAIIQSLLVKYSVHTTLINFNNFGCVIISTLIFILFYDLKAEKKNCVCKMFRKITDTSFSFFLLDYFFEQVFYQERFTRKGYDTFMERLPHLLYVVPIAVVGGIICSFITHFLTIFIMKILDCVINMFKDCYKRKENEKNEFFET